MVNVKLLYEAISNLLNMLVYMSVCDIKKVVVRSDIKFVEYVSLHVSVCSSPNTVSRAKSS